MKFILSLLVIASFIFSMGCDKNKTVRELREKSAELSTYGAKLTAAFGDAFKAGEITREQLAALNKVTGAFVTGVGVYRSGVAEAERIVKSGEPLPPDLLGQVEKVLDDQVFATFFDILAQVGVLPIAKSEIVKTTITAIRLTLLTIKGAFADAQHYMEVKNARFA